MNLPPRRPRPAAAEPEGTRLSKIVAELKDCSRREAELYIEGGWVTVAGQIVDVPGTRVLNQPVLIAADANLAPVQSVTLLLHKPPGCTDATDPERRSRLQSAVDLICEASRFAEDRSGIRLVRQHFKGLEGVTPLEDAASGLVVLTQDWRVRRKLVEDAALIEHELSVDVTGEVTPQALAQLNRSPVVDGRAMLPAKVSINRQNEGVTGLRFAIKGSHPGQIAQMCDAVQLRVQAIKRLRVGRVPLAGLPPGQWRCLMGYERF